MAILSWITSNLKWVAVIAALALVSAGGWKAYHVIQDNALQYAKIERLENEIKIKDLSIDLLKQSMAITKEVVNDRDQKMAEIQKSLDDLKTDDLPDDKKDLAPASTRIFLDRLKGISPE